MSTFPAYVRILRDGYSAQPDRGLLRSDMDDGLAKQRMRYSAPVTQEQCTIHVKRDQRVLFDLWVDSVGAGWFDYRPPCGDTRRARIVAPYAWEPHGLGWSAKLVLEYL